MTKSAKQLISDRVTSVSLSQSVPHVTRAQAYPSAQDDYPQQPHSVHLRKRKASQHPLRELRVKAGMTLEALSKATSMSPSYLSRLESGSRRLNEDIISRLSKALSCVPGALLMQERADPQTDGSDAVAAYHHTHDQPDMPVFMIHNCGDEQPHISSKADHMIHRPSDYVSVPNAFACLLKESLWAPRYQKGDTLLLNPYASLKDGCSIMVRTKTKAVYIGTYKASHYEALPTTLTVVTAYSPDKKELTFSLKEIEAFRITGTIER